MFTAIVITAFKTSTEQGESIFSQQGPFLWLQVLILPFWHYPCNKKSRCVCVTSLVTMRHRGDTQ